MHFIVEKFQTCNESHFSYKLYGFYRTHSNHSWCIQKDKFCIYRHKNVTTVDINIMMHVDDDGKKTWQ